jgi:hypothetical protein
LSREELSRGGPAPSFASLYDPRALTAEVFYTTLDQPIVFPVLFFSLGSRKSGPRFADLELVDLQPSQIIFLDDSAIELDLIPVARALSARRMTSASANPTYGPALWETRLVKWAAMRSLVRALRHLTHGKTFHVEGREAYWTPEELKRGVTHQRTLEDVFVPDGRAYQDHLFGRWDIATTRKNDPRTGEPELRSSSPLQLDRIMTMDSIDGLMGCYLTQE